MTTTTAVVIEPGDRLRASATLTLAFATDPIVRWAYPDSQQYAIYWPRFIDVFAGRAFESGTAYRLDGFAAIALWLPPGIGPDEAAMASLLQESTTDGVWRDLDGFMGQMGDFHPSFEHWYLPLTGVDPIGQGRGLGSALLHHALAACDRDGLPAYLEATSPRSRDLYDRHGFESLGVIQAGSSPPMWPMLRQPRPQADVAGS